MGKGVAIVTGTPGVGKTTILERIAKGGKYTVVGLGTLMLEAAMKKGYVKHRDEMRKLDNEKVTELRDVAVDAIAAMKGPVLVDTHASIETNGKYCPGLPADMMKRMKDLRGLIHVDAPTDQIVERRHRDKSRIREAGIMEIETQRTINLAALSYYSSLLNVPLYVVYNRNGMLDDSLRNLEGKLKDMFGE